jgi:4-amino-4-deoxy-L-arabinose transferase-like glycosyltransferase
MRTLVILGLAYALFFHGLGAVSLWDPDEPRQAIEAREMMARGDYVHPYLNGVPYLEKPPLYPWLIILTARITGKVDEFSARLPSAVAATLLLLLTYFLGRRLDHEVSGFLSALILATNYQFLGNGREAVMDMVFALCIGLSVFLGYVSLEKEKRWLLLLALLPCAAAVLAKGPAGLVIPVGVLFFYSVVTRRFKASFVPLATGSLLALALASIWFYLAGKAYIDEFILHQNITRYMTGFDHVEPFWYYFPKLFVNFLPWSIALPFATFFAYRRRLWLPLIWLLFTFLFFDVSKSKRAIYLLPCYPACALLVGTYLKERWYGFIEKRWTAILLCLFGVVLTIVPVCLFPAMGRLPLLRQIFGEGMPFLGLLVFSLTVCGLVFLLSVLRNAPGKGFLALFIYLGFLGFVYHSHYMPAVDRSSKSVRPITDHLKDVPATTPVYFYGFNSPALIFYLDRPVRIVVNPADIDAEKDDVVVIAEDSRGRADPLKAIFPAPAKARYEHDNYLIFSRKNGG